jgi:sulfate adenylyltransferase
MIEPWGGFIEIHVATSIDVCESRDRKGLYAKARAGLIAEFTGVSDPYEVPEKPELAIDTALCGVDEAVQSIVLKLEHEGFLR